MRSIPNQVYFYKRDPILKLIEEEYISLIYSDAVDYPPADGMEFPEKEIPYREKIDEELLEEAQALIRAEMLNENPYQYDAVRELGLNQLVKLNPATKTVEIVKHDTVDDAKIRYQSNHAHYVSPLPMQLAELKKSNLTEKKCTVTLAGYERLLRERTTESNGLISRLNELQIKRRSLEQLREQELRATSQRTTELQQYYKLVYDST